MQLCTFLFFIFKKIEKYDYNVQLHSYVFIFILARIMFTISDFNYSLDVNEYWVTQNHTLHQYATTLNGKLSK